MEPASVVDNSWQDRKPSAADTLDPMFSIASYEDVEAVAGASPRIGEVLQDFVASWGPDGQLAPAPASHLSGIRRYIHVLLAGGHYSVAAAVTNALLSNGNEYIKGDSGKRYSGSTMTAATDPALPLPYSLLADPLSPFFESPDEDYVRAVREAEPPVGEVLNLMRKAWCSGLSAPPAPASILADRRREVQALTANGRVYEAAALSNATLGVDAIATVTEYVTGFGLRVLHPVSIPLLAMTIYHYGGLYYVFPRTPKALGAIVIAGRVFQVVDSPPVRTIRALRRSRVVRWVRSTARRLVRCVHDGRQGIRRLAFGMLRSLISVLGRVVTAPVCSAVGRLPLLSPIFRAVTLMITAFGRVIFDTLSTLFVTLSKATKITLYAWWQPVGLLMRYILGATLIAIRRFVAPSPEARTGTHRSDRLARWIGLRPADPEFISSSLERFFRLPQQAEMGPGPHTSSGPSLVESPHARTHTQPAS